MLQDRLNCSGGILFYQDSLETCSKSFYLATYIYSYHIHRYQMVILEDKHLLGMLKLIQTHLYITMMTKMVKQFGNDALSKQSGCWWCSMTDIMGFNSFWSCVAFLSLGTS